MSHPSAGSDPRGWLTSLEHFGIKLGLSGIHAICAALGHPERQFRSIHIAGTNGKGSVAAMVDEGLRAAGHRVGRYTSPHLIHLEERVTVAGEPVGAVPLDGAIATVRGTVDALLASGSLASHPTFFEVLTAAAFVIFARAGIELAVLEVGLGGRFDATNVVDPMVAAITSIALDHEQHLGTTLEAIAFEKAGIIKPGATVIVGALPHEALGIVRQACDERGSTLHDASLECSVTAEREYGKTVLHLATPRRVYPRVVLALRGRHQVQNATVAVRVLETVEGLGVPVGAGAILDGMVRARWPARLDLVTAAEGREVLVDGAHNPAGAAALAAYIRSEWPAGLPIVFGAMRDKDVARMLEPLSPLAHPLILTTAPGIRAAPAEDLAAVARAQGTADLVVCSSVDEALTAAWTRAPRIAAAGSLYLAGRVLALLRSDL